MNNEDIAEMNLYGMIGSLLVESRRTSQLVKDEIAYLSRIDDTLKRIEKVVESPTREDPLTKDGPEGISVLERLSTLEYQMKGQLGRLSNIDDRVKRLGGVESYWAPSKDSVDI